MRAQLNDLRLQTGEFGFNLIEEAKRKLLQIHDPCACACGVAVRLACPPLYQRLQPWGDDIKRWGRVGRAHDQCAER